LSATSFTGAGTGLTGTAASLSIGGNAATATSATTATNIAGGTNLQIPYNTGAGATSFIAAPTLATTYLQYNGTGFVWAAVSATTATNLLGGATGSIPYQSATNVTTFLAGNTTTTPQFVTSTGVAGLPTAPTLTGSTGSGNVVLATSPTLVTPALGTPSALVGTNITGTASSLSIGGNAATATSATNTAITDDTTTATSVYPTWVTTTSGNLPQKTSSTKLSFVPSTGAFTATSFSGSGSGITGLSQEVGQCRLVYTNSTTITLIPCNGQYIKIAGVLYAIPSAGVTLSNSGLSASTLYYIYAYISGGNVTLSASATGYATDTTAGNVGVKILSGNNAYTLVGMVYMYTGGVFVDNASNRQVLSYYNRLDKYLFGTAANYSTTNTALTVVTPIIISSLNWIDDGISVWLATQAGMTGAYGYSVAIFDNNTANSFGVKQYIYGNTGSLNPPTTLGGWNAPGEGFHSYYIAIGASSGSGTISINNCTATGYVRG
jgi:hypothetical protein